MRAARGSVRGFFGRPAAPIVALALVSLLSLGARASWIDRTEVLVFDETYYVNASRAILGLRIPAGAAYYNAPPGTDPNAEHPPLAKLLIVASMDALGDRPVGWRVPSLIFGSLSILAMYFVARAARAGPWLAVGAASLMAVDNLFLIHGGIATLDIFVIPFMLAAAGLYLRARPVAGGLVLGVGACMKLVGLLLVLILVIVEVISLIPSRSKLSAPRRRVRESARAVATFGIATTIAYLGLLYSLDARMSNFRNPVAHTAHMLTYAGALTDPGTGAAPASSPWQWLVNRGAIPYYIHYPEKDSAPPVGARPTVFFEGRINPFIIYMALPGLVVAALAARRRPEPLPVLILAWYLGTFLPFVALSLLQRVLYIHYMLLVLPGIYLAVAELFSGRYLHRSLTVGYVVALGYAFWAFYPFRTFTG